MNRLIHLGLAVWVGSLAGCVSTTPVRYHTLLAPAAQATTAGEPVGFLIDVLPVGIPASLDQPQLVVRKGGGEVALLEGERWAGTMADEVRDALSVELAHRLATQDIAGLVQPSGGPVLRIKLQVRRLDAWPGQRIQFEADWILGFANEAGNARLVCSGRFDEPASGGYPELVQSQQRAMASLAARIAADARAWASLRQADCS